jgi:hypothetical protein
MDEVFTAQGDLATANGPGRDGATGLAVHLEGFGERGTIVGGTDVEKVAMRGISFEVDEVENAGAAYYLGLQAVVRDAECSERRGVTGEGRSTQEDG